MSQILTCDIVSILSTETKYVFGSTGESLDIKMILVFSFVMG